MRKLRILRRYTLFKNQKKYDKPSNRILKLKIYYRYKIKL